MGASGPSREGPANRYEKPKKKNPISKFIGSGGVLGTVVETVKKASKKSKQNVLDYEGQAAGVTPMRNPINQRDRESDNLPTLVTASNTPPEPIIIKKNIGGTEVQTTDVKLAEEKKKTEEAEDEYDVRRTKRRGRRMTILTPTGGVRGDFVLGKPTLLGS